MLKFTHVEDYIEMLAGYDPGSGVIFNSGKYTFSLARYDVQIVESMAASTLWSSQALTDRQGELAVKLVIKYKRQFAKYGIDISPVEENPQWRFPLRTVDRSLRIWREGDDLLAKFPYNSQWIEDFRKLKDSAQGRSQWDPEAKLWRLGVTEYNVNWLVTWGQMNKFEIDSDVVDLYTKVISAENPRYEIKLVQQGEQLAITNAAPSLVEYVETKLGGFGKDNLVRLADAAGVLGYSIDSEIELPELLNLFGDQRMIHVPSTESGSLDLIFDYAELADRWPVYIYNPGTTQQIDLSRFSDSEIVKFDPAGKTKTPDYNFWTTKVIYVNKIPKVWQWPIPLLVSTVEMMYGGARMEWMTRAEKIIHYSYIPLREKD
jgi:hypothetical protein